jgi:hypothetical protein
VKRSRDNITDARRGEAALAVAVLKSAVREIEERLVHVRATRNAAARKKHLGRIALMWRFCAEENHWHMLCGVDPQAVRDKLRRLVTDGEFDQMIEAYRRIKLLATAGDDETTSD